MLLFQHPDICEFPSQHFYQERLITPESVINRDRETIYNEIFINFWPSRKEKSDYVPLVFCNAVGEEEELVVTTEEGNQRSKSNQKEKDKVVSLRDT